MCRRDNLQVLTLAHSTMNAIGSNLNEAPGRGPISVAPDQERLVARMVKSNEFLDQAFPGRYLLNPDFNPINIHVFFTNMEENYKADTCDLMIMDGRLHQEALAHALGAFEFRHHPDSHALLWFIPDDLLHSSINSELLENFKMTSRLSSLAAFGEPAAPRTSYLQGKLVLANFRDGASKYKEAGIPRKTVQMAFEAVKAGKILMAASL